MNRKMVVVLLDYADVALVPGGISRCEPSTEAELVEEIERHLNASSDACKGGISLRILEYKPEEAYLVAEAVELAAELKAIRANGEDHGGLPGWAYWDRKGRWYKDIGDYTLNVYRCTWEVLKRDASGAYMPAGNGEHVYAPRATMRMLEGIVATGGDFTTKRAP